MEQFNSANIFTYFNPSALKLNIGNNQCEHCWLSV